MNKGKLTGIHDEETVAQWKELTDRWEKLLEKREKIIVDDACDKQGRLEFWDKRLRQWEKSLVEREKAFNSGGPQLDEIIEILKHQNILISQIDNNTDRI